MSLSPSYRDRASFPHQPRPPEHWPVYCEEIGSHARLRVWRCPACERVHEFKSDDVRGAIGLACYRDGTAFVREEPRS